MASLSSATPQRLPFWRQLRWHLILACVCLAVLPAGLVAGVTISRSQEQAGQLVFNQLESVAELKQQQIARWLHDSEQTLSFLVAGATQERFSAFLTAPDADQATQASINGLLQQALSFYRQQHDVDEAGSFEALFLYTTEGRIVAASDPTFIGRIVTRQPYFEHSLSERYIQPPYYAVGNATLTMMVTLPVHDEAGQIVGVMAGQLNLTSLGQIMLQRSGLGASGETYLVSLENNYLLTPSRFSEYSMTQAYHSEGIDRALAGQNGAGVYADYRGEGRRVLGVYRWVPELQAALLAEMDESEALASSIQARNLTMLLAMGAIVAALVYGIFTATRIAGPIKLLARTATEIAHGALDRRVHIAARNEIGVLAQAFNSMTAELQDTQLGLEQRIAERTGALQGALAEVESRAEEQQRLLGELEAQRAVIRELSVPVIPITADTMVMPLVGALDRSRIEQVQTQALRAVEATSTRYLVLDITGVPIIDSQVAQGLVAVMQAIRLLGSEVILVGIRPEVAQTMVGLGILFHELRTFVDLQTALHFIGTRQTVAVAGR
jgi:anti-anti-sigma regulatory factor/HAMP domain-containing protein